MQTRIIYLERGVKIAEGSKDELLSSCEPFRLMWEALFHTEKTLAVHEIEHKPHYTERDSKT